MEVTGACGTGRPGSDCQHLFGLLELDCDVATLPATHETLQAIGRRLSRSYSERELSVIASRAELLLGQLERGERLALARGYLRFQVDSPVIVDVAVPVESVPFWIADQGFEATDLTLNNGDTAWIVYRKAFERRVDRAGSQRS